MRRAAAALLLLAAGAAGAQETPPPGRIETFPRAGPPAGGAAPETEKALPREDSVLERRRRDEAVFDSTGRIQPQRDQLRRTPGLATDRLRSSQRPGYSVGPGVNIIRRAP